jgi:hypothetical protein
MCQINLQYITYMQILENDEEIDLDAMVMCTGYKYKFPFLSEEIISTEGEHVTPLYKHNKHGVCLILVQIFLL